MIFSSALLTTPQPAEDVENTSNKTCPGTPAFAAKGKRKTEQNRQQVTTGVKDFNALVNKGLPDGYKILDKKQNLTDNEFSFGNEGRKLRFGSKDHTKVKYRGNSRMKNHTFSFH
jgi:hypothetical protein